MFFCSVINHSIASSVGSSLDEWIRSASTEGFRAETLPIKLNVSATFDIREFAGKNVIGHMKGNQDDVFCLFTGYCIWCCDCLFLGACSGS